MYYKTFNWNNLLVITKRPIRGDPFSNDFHQDS